MKAVCVFCGSSLGSDPEFVLSAKALGKTLAQSKITLIYGGSNIGIMGVVANSALENGGKVIGVIPRFLAEKEIAHSKLSELIVVESMHERKMKMFELAEGFIAMPGGFGTLEEVSEILTWHQLGLHHYPIGIFNVNGYFNHLKLFFEEMEGKNLLKTVDLKMALFEENLSQLLESMGQYRSPNITKIITRETT